MSSGLHEENECSARGCNTVWYSLRSQRYCNDHKHKANSNSTTSTKKKKKKSQQSTKSSDGYYDRHKGPKWRENRWRAKFRDGFQCVECGITESQHRHRKDLWGRGLHVHHITPVREYDDYSDAHVLDNLETVCDACHKEKTANE